MAIMYSYKTIGEVGVYNNILYLQLCIGINFTLYITMICIVSGFSRKTISCSSAVSFVETSFSHSPDTCRLRHKTRLNVIPSSEDAQRIYIYT